MTTYSGCSNLDAKIKNKEKKQKPNRKTANNSGTTHHGDITTLEAQAAKPFFKV